MLLVSIARKLKLQNNILQLIHALTHLHNSVLIQPIIPIVLLGNFNTDLIQGNSEQKARKKYLITDKGYTQLINQFTTDYRTHSTVDHVYTNVYNQQVPWSLTAVIISLFFISMKAV